MAVEVASLYGTLSLRDNATNALRSFDSTLDAVGARMRSIGGTMTTFITAPIVAGLTGATVAALNFDTAMTNAASVLGLTRDEMADLNAEVLAIGSASRAGPQAAAEAFYEIVSGVADASTHMAILNAAIATSEAGSADLTTTTSGLIAVMNAYRLEADQAAFVSDVFSRSVQLGVGSMDEFVASLNPLAAMGSQLSVGIEELGGAMAYMTTQGHTANTAMTAIRQAMVAFLNPNTAMEAALASMGFTSGEAAIQQLGLVGAMQALNDAVGGSTGQMAAALGSVEALNAGLAFAGDGIDTFMESYTEGLDGATLAAQEIQNASPQAMFEELRSSIMGVAIQIGTALLPVLSDIAEAVIPIVQQIASWISENPQLATTIVAVAAAIAALGPVITVLGVAIGALTGPIGLVVLAIAGIATAYLTNFGGFRDFVDNEVIPRLQAVGDWWTETGQPRLQAAVDWIETTGVPRIEAGVSWFEETGVPRIEAGVSWFEETALPRIRAGFDWITGTAVPRVVAAVESLRGPFETVFNWIWTNVIQPFITRIEGFVGNIQDAVHRVTTFVNNPQSAVDYYTSGQTSQNVLNFIEGGAADIFHGLGFAGGGYTGDGPANEVAGSVHKGEYVVPQDGALVMRGNSGLQVDTINVYANSREEGQAAAAGFMDELEQRMRSYGG